MVQKGEIIRIDSNELKGGSTRPLLVTANVNGTLKNYVLKIFKTESSGLQNYLFSEVLANRMAKMFDLQVPEAVLLKVDPDYWNILDPNIKARFIQSEDEWHFASELIPDAADYLPGFHTSQLHDWEAATIWAFDHLIYNIDRRLEKTNLLIRNQDAYVIDHDLAFNAGTELTNRFLSGDASIFHFERLSKSHIFHEYMTDSRKRNNDCLDTFQEYFHRISFTQVQDEILDILNLGVKQNRVNLVIEYLRALFENKAAFINVLKTKAKL